MDISEATWFLRAEGKRITPERRLLLLISGNNAHRKASELDQLAGKENSKISLSTVYRTVKLLKELGLVEASVLGDHYHYEVCLNEHYHLICLGCGNVAEIPPVGALKELGEKEDFEVLGGKMELLEYREECRKSRDLKERSLPYDNARGTKTAAKGCLQDRPAGSPAPRAPPPGFPGTRTVRHG